MSNLDQVIKDIQSVKIQGAGNICRASLFAWQTHLLNLKTGDTLQYLSHAKKIGKRLSSARPNEPLTANSFKYLNDRLKDSVKIKNLFISINDLKKLTRQYVEDFLMLLHDNGQKIAEYGSQLIKNKDNIFTHCHSRNVENILIAAKKSDKNFHVYNDETRPLFQGRITSVNLARHNISNTMVVDAAAPFLVSDISGDDIKIHRVFLGFDVILPDGSALNKIGSFGIALAAYTSKIPIYLAGSLMKYSRRRNIKIELRSREEVWPSNNTKIKIINYAFDKIPTKFITSYITEFGIVKPSNLNKYLKKYNCI